MSDPAFTGVDALVTQEYTLTESPAAYQAFSAGSVGKLAHGRTPFRAALSPASCPSIHAV